MNLFKTTRPLSLVFLALVVFAVYGSTMNYEVASKYYVDYLVIGINLSLVFVVTGIGISLVFGGKDEKFFDRITENWIALGFYEPTPWVIQLFIYACYMANIVMLYTAGWFFGAGVWLLLAAEATVIHSLMRKCLTPGRVEIFIRAALLNEAMLAALAAIDKVKKQEENKHD